MRVVGQLLSYPCQDHWDVVVQILKYIKKALGKGFIYKIKEILKLLDADWAWSPSYRGSTSGHYVLVRGNLIS